MWQASSLDEVVPYMNVGATSLPLFVRIRLRVRLEREFLVICEFALEDS